LAILTKTTGFHPVYQDSSRDSYNSLMMSEVAFVPNVFAASMLYKKPHH